MSKKSPQLRFEGFTDDWEQRKLGKVFKTYSGMTPLRSDISNFKNPEVPWIKTTDLKNSDITSNDEKISAKAANKLKVLPVNTVLIAMYGGFNQIGRTGLLTYPATINQALTALEPNDSISPYFLLTELNYRVNDWKKFAASSRKDPNITKRDIDNFMINFPTQQEQQKVGSFFQQLDNTITLHQRKLDLLKEQKKGYLQKMFPKNGAKVPELRFAGFADDWEERKLENIAQINKGIQRGKQEISSVRNELNPYPVYNGGKKASGYTDECNRENSVMVSEGGASAGYVNYYSGKYWSGGHNFTISNDTKHDTFFLLYVLQKSQEKLYKLQVGTGLPNIQLKSIKDFPIYSTSNTEQQKIGSFFKQLDNTIALHQRKLDLLKEQKKGFLQKMFV